MRKMLSVIALICIVGITVFTQGSGTPSTLRVRTDSLNTLMITGAAQTPPYTTSIFGNTILRTDSNGNLIVASASGGLVAAEDVAPGTFGPGEYVFDGGSVIDPATPLTIQQTWNDAADIFSAFTINITDTNSNVNSHLLQINRNGSDIFEVTKSGFVTAQQFGTAASPANYVYFSTSSAAGWYELNTGASGGMSLGSGHGICWDSAATNTPGTGCNGAAKLTRTSAAAVGVTNGLQMITGTRPTCNSTARGMFWYVAGGAGVADTIEVCRKDAADAYAWVTII